MHALFTCQLCYCMHFSLVVASICYRGSAEERNVVRYEPVLVQEMLTLIIQLVKERRFCGLTTTESLKRELIYKLAIGNATHSQLVKSLPRDLSKIDQLQEILDTIALYSEPSGVNQVLFVV